MGVSWFQVSSFQEYSPSSPPFRLLPLLFPHAGVKKSQEVGESLAKLCLKGEGGEMVAGL